MAAQDSCHSVGGATQHQPVSVEAPHQPTEDPETQSMHESEPTRDNQPSELVDDLTAASQNVQVQEKPSSHDDNSAGRGKKPSLFPSVFLGKKARSKEKAKVDARSRANGCSWSKEVKEQKALRCHGAHDLRSGDSKPPEIDRRGAKYYLSRLLTKLHGPDLPSPSPSSLSSSSPSSPLPVASKSERAASKSKHAWVPGRWRNARNDGGISTATSRASPPPSTSYPPRTSSLFHPADIGQESYKRSSRSETHPHQLPIRDYWNNRRSQYQTTSITPSSEALRYSNRSSQYQSFAGAISAPVEASNRHSQYQSLTGAASPPAEAIHPNYRRKYQSFTGAIQSGNRVPKNSRQYVRNSMSNHGARYRGSTGHLLEHEATRTWRGLFTPARELSYPASTVSSTAYSLSSSSTGTSSSSSETKYRPRSRYEQDLRKSVLAVPPTYNEKRPLPKGSMSRKLSIVVIGDGAVGKSALTLRFLRDQFHDEYDPTIDDSYCKHIEVDGQEYTLDINDTAGQQEYRGDWNDQFLRAGDGFICVYSVTSTSSLEQLIAFRDQIWRAKEGLHVPMVIVGNKRDKSDQGEREISTEVGARLAENSRALFIEASAKTGFNVDDIFIALVREIVKPREERRIAETTSVLPMLEKTPPTPVHECTHVTPATTSRKHRKKPKKTIRCCTIM